VEDGKKLPTAFLESSNARSLLSGHCISENELLVKLGRFATIGLRGMQDSHGNEGLFGLTIVSNRTRQANAGGALVTDRPLLDGVLADVLQNFCECQAIM